MHGKKEEAATPVGYVVSYARDWRKQPSLKWTGNAACESEARAIASMLLEHVREVAWGDAGAERFADLTSKVRAEPSDRPFRMMSIHVSTEFSAAGQLVKSAAWKAGDRESTAAMRFGMTSRMASETLAAILATDPAFALAAATNGACATLRRTAANSEPAWTRLLAEGPAIDYGPDQMELNAGRARTCVIRGRDPLPVSNATQVAAIVLAGVTLAIENGDRCEHGSPPPAESATLRAARIAAIPKAALAGADLAHRRLTAVGRPTIADAILEQGRATANRATGAMRDAA